MMEPSALVQPSTAKKIRQLAKRDALTLAHMPSPLNQENHTLALATTPF